MAFQLFRADVQQRHARVLHAVHLRAQGAWPMIANSTSCSAVGRDVRAEIQHGADAFARRPARRQRRALHAFGLLQDEHRLAHQRAGVAG
jgi:hypothetical protein